RRSGSDRISTKSGPGPAPALFGYSPTNGRSAFAPLSSGLGGSGCQLAEAMLEFYSTIPPEPILDSTYNAGRFWKYSTREVVSMDIDPQHKPIWLRDNRDMHGIPDSSFGTVVFDPPHIGPQGRDKSVKRFNS